MSKQESMKEGWYLLKTRARQELRADENLTNQGFDAYCPTITRPGAAESKEEILFPGYLFLYLDLKDLDRYHKIRSTRGVSTIVQFNKVSRKLFEDGRLPAHNQSSLQELLPQPIPNGEVIIQQVKEMIVYLETDPEPVQEAFSTGDTVTVCNPLYEHLKATFVKGVSMDRGVILIQYIKEQRNANGTVEKKEIMPAKKMTVKLKDLKKTDGYQSS